MKLKKKTVRICEHHSPHRRRLTLWAAAVVAKNTKHEIGRSANGESINGCDRCSIFLCVTCVVRVSARARVCCVCRRLFSTNKCATGDVTFFSFFLQSRILVRFYRNRFENKFNYFLFIFSFLCIFHEVVLFALCRCGIRIATFGTLLVFFFLTFHRQQQLIIISNNCFAVIKRHTFRLVASHILVYTHSCECKHV